MVTGAELRSMRVGVGISLRTLAREIGLDKSTYCRIEAAGTKAVRPDLVLAALDTFSHFARAITRRNQSRNSFQARKNARTRVVNTCDYAEYDFVAQVKPTPRQVKVMVRGGKPITYLGEADKAARQEVVAAFRRAYGNLARPIAQPVRLQIAFTIATPNQKRWGKPVGRRPDLTNLLAAVENALIGLAYVDDQLVAEQAIKKVYGEHDGLSIHVGCLGLDNMPSTSPTPAQADTGVGPQEAVETATAPVETTLASAGVPPYGPTTESYYDHPEPSEEQARILAEIEEMPEATREYWRKREEAQRFKENMEAAGPRSYPVKWGHPWASRRMPEREFTGYENWQRQRGYSS